MSLLAVATLFVHGYHPWAEDGGLYVVGVEYTLDPTLFPHETTFVTSHLPYSIFTSSISSLVRLTHGSLGIVLFSVYLLSTTLMFFAALRIAKQCFGSPVAQWTAVALLAAWWTLPVAGTSLLLMDPYVTARSLSTPFSLLAVSAAMQTWPSSSRAGHDASWSRRHRRPLILRSPVIFRSPAVLCAIFLVTAAAFHPLMAVYALGLVGALRCLIQPGSPWRFAALGLLILALAGGLQSIAQPEGPAVLAALHTRYYWFLRQWHWFEWMGLLGPLLIFAALLRWRTFSLSHAAQAACRAALAFGSLAGVLTLIFAQEHFRAHAVARLQPLRAFLLLYALMIVLLGGTLAQAAETFASRPRQPAISRLLRSMPALLLTAFALLMFSVQRATFPASLHLELPGRHNPNPWVEAFLWADLHTPKDALFALDAHYINTPGEDAQTFRALALRDALPDFAKDGGEAANIPRLAPAWWRAVLATENLSQLADRERDARLRPFNVDWVVLHAKAATSHTCPYKNAVVKICRLR